MSYGYENGFIIEHDPTLKGKISCADCFYYEKADKSCNKCSYYLPEDGYGSWKNCKFFELKKDVSNYESKYKQLKNTKNKFIDIEPKSSKSVSINNNSKETIKTECNIQFIPNLNYADKKPIKTEVKLYIEKLVTGSRCYHKDKGEGTVLSIKKNIIEVKFIKSGKVVPFNYGALKDKGWVYVGDLNGVIKNKKR